MNKIYDTIIVGSGPAGMTAAIYLKRNPEPGLSRLRILAFTGQLP